MRISRGRELSAIGLQILGPANPSFAHAGCTIELNGNEVNSWVYVCGLHVWSYIGTAARGGVGSPCMEVFSTAGH